MKSTRLSVVIAFCALQLFSCNESESVKPSADGDFVENAEITEARESDEDTPRWPEAPQCTAPLVPVGQSCEALKLPELGSQWQKIALAGETGCARGTPFYFWARGGKVNRLLVSFRGGGACWNASTCAVNEKDPFFSDSIDADHDPAVENEGIFKLDQPENPFTDWYMVHIPYCTGDLHWGAKDVTYPARYSSPEITVKHRGAINANAAIDWIAAHFNAPERLFVTGGSAGAYGSELHSARLMTIFPYAGAVNLGDGGSGVFQRDFYLDAIPRWGFRETCPTLPGYSDLAYAKTDYADFRIALAQYFTGRTFAHATTFADETQESYYLLTGGDVTAWSAEMIALVSRVAQKADNYRYFIMPGKRHVTLYSNEFYTAEINGERYRDWVAKLAEGQPVTSARCSECE